MKLFSKINLQKACWFAAVSMTAVAVFLHFFSLAVAGGLWRDEIGLVNIAGLPTWKEIVWGLMHDHCPVVFPAVIRMWTALGLAQTDTGLRALGLCVGLFLLASFWFASRMMGKGLPLLSLSLAAMNPVVIRYGDSMRAYGFGSALMILAIGLLWRFIEQPGWRRGLLAGVAAVVSVQTLYQNAFFLLAICVGGMTVSFRQRQYRKLAGILSIGFVAALSLAPYVKPILAAQGWWDVSRLRVNKAILLDHLLLLTGNFLGLWFAVLVLAAAFGLSRIFQAAKPAATDAQNELPLFGGIALVLGAAGFLVFIKLSGLPTQVWYYIPLLCFSVICCDLIFPRVQPVTIFAVLAVAIFSLAVSPSDLSGLRWRQTNGDLLAAQVAKSATPEDLIIVHPWYFGLTFNYYYHGTAKWTTLPPIADYRFHRYDLIKEKIQMTNAIAPVFEQVEATLRSGHRVWIVGEISAPRIGVLPPPDPPVAPNGPSGWLDEPYFSVWGKQLGYFLQHHAVKIMPVAADATNLAPINPLEKMTLTVASGWQTDSP